ncbi:MAG: hypothetical protein HRT35_22490, partial [Algicola sp.]|nr:hypothetical protein [Algicola sp.]
LHAKAMGPGVMGQLKAYSPDPLNPHNQNKQQQCLSCHAPLKSQNKSLIAAISGQKSTNLHQQGIICAACHVRNDHWFGPGPLPGVSKVASTVKKGHQTSTSHEAFKSAAFCATCHQFGDDDRKLEGKLLQNTYVEWQNSVFAKQNISCQNCHMPGRRHQWQGIHSKAMVLKGLTLSAQLLSQISGQIKAKLGVINSGVGHYFPTYVTPRVVLQGYQQDKTGQMLEDTLVEEEIMRAVSMDLNDEYFDSRLPPGGQLVLDYQEPLDSQAATMVLRIVVEPDFFYEQFNTAMLETDGKLLGRELLKQAKDNAAKSAYVLFEKSFGLN